YQVLRRGRAGPVLDVPARGGGRVRIRDGQSQHAAPPDLEVVALRDDYDRVGGPRRDGLVCEGAQRGPHAADPLLEGDVAGGPVDEELVTVVRVQVPEGEACAAEGHVVKGEGELLVVPGAAGVDRGAARHIHHPARERHRSGINRPDLVDVVVEVVREPSDLDRVFAAVL